MTAFQDIDTATFAPTGSFGPVGSPSGIYSTSGGIVGPYSGTWMVEEQDLGVQYCRVPTYFRGNHVLTLSSYTVSEATARGGIGGTALACLINASYERKKVIAHYQSSSFTQLQKFEINGTSSLQGVNYGPLSANQLGPQGFIVSKHKYYNRRKWIDGVDTEVGEVAWASNMAYNTSGSMGGSSVTWEQAFRYHNNLEANFIPPSHQYTPNWTGWFTQAHQQPRLYSLPGPYYITQETSPTAVWNMLDTIGTYLRQERLAREWPIHSNDRGHLHPDDFIGVPSYDKSRHDYS